MFVATVRLPPGKCLTPESAVVVRAVFPFGKLGAHGQWDASSFSFQTFPALEFGFLRSPMLNHPFSSGNRLFVTPFG